jgi:hypothetical protein
MPDQTIAGRRIKEFADGSHVLIFLERWWCRGRGQAAGYVAQST